jgi:hypothetical protein
MQARSNRLTYNKEMTDQREDLTHELVARYWVAIRTAAN